MKKFILYSLLISVVMTSCNQDPEAYFSVSTTTPEVGQEVHFNNGSHNAKRYEWDFGDGYISTLENPSHIYTGTGVFTVSLKITSKNGLSDEAYIDINVLIPTLLKIEVREYYDEYVVPDASVYLFATLPNWETGYEEDVISSGYTNEEGIVVFSNLDPFVYYVDVWEAHHDNYILAGDDLGFIRTPEVLPNRINEFVAWVDYYEDHSKGNERSERKMKIIKLERKPSDKEQYNSDLGTEGWEELYNIRSGK